MIATDFILFFNVFGFFGYFLCFLFFLGTILLFVWFLVYFSVFLVTDLSGNEGTATPPPLLERELSVLTRLNGYSREPRRLSRSELPFRPGGWGLVKGVIISIRSARSAR